MSVYFALFHELCICVSSFRGFEELFDYVAWYGPFNLFDAVGIMQICGNTEGLSKE